MNHRLTALERAFQIADSGRCRTADEIVVELGREGYVDAAAALYGRTLRKQLALRCATARSAGSTGPCAPGLSATTRRRTTWRAWKAGEPATQDDG